MIPRFGNPTKKERNDAARNTGNETKFSSCFSRTHSRSSGGRRRLLGCPDDRGCPIRSAPFGKRWFDHRAHRIANLVAQRFRLRVGDRQSAQRGQHGASLSVIVQLDWHRVYRQANRHTMQIAADINTEEPLTRKSRDHFPSSGTDSSRQILCTSRSGISRCRGTASTAPVKGFTHSEWPRPSRFR